MTARCKKCNQCEWFDKNDEFGIRLKLRDQSCECGGKFERVTYVNGDVYQNRKGTKYELTPIGEFRNYNPEPTDHQIERSNEQ